MRDLSIIIVNWNTKDLLRECLHSLQEGFVALATEIHVVDNGSTDGSIEMVESEFPQIILTKNYSNLGFARANNLALRSATGRFLLLLNSDTVVRSGAVEGLIQTMEADSSIGVAGLQLLNSDGSLQNSICTFPSLLTELTNKSILRLLFPSRFPGKEHRITAPKAVEAIIGSCMLVRKEAVEEVGLLDEDFFFFLEETDWCLRMHKAGWKVVFDPRYSIFHLQGKSAAKVNVRARIEYWRSRYTYFRKHFGMLTRCVLSAGLLVRLLCSICLLSLANAATLFASPVTRRKLRVYIAILQWHIKGRPADGGLETSNAPQERIV